MDVHVRREVSVGLRIRGIDVLTSQDDKTTEWPDDKLLDRATSLGRILFTQDSDFLVEAARRNNLVSVSPV
jgi:predicted nuclease of predicted toxin-antitoxin system